MTHDPEEKPELPKGRGRAVILPPGEKLRMFTEEELPQCSGPTRRIAFRADATDVDCLNRELDRLHEIAPSHIITVADALRSLIRRGAPPRKPSEDE